MTSITPDLIQRQPWRFGRSDGSIIHQSLVFLPGGLIQPNGPGEARWAIEDGVLVLYTEKGEESTRFSGPQHVAGGGCRLKGRFLLNLNASYHFLDSLVSQPPLKESRLNTSMTLTGESDSLLVIFNSAGQPVEGRESRWEFYRLPEELGLDVVRFAEARSPATFYLDKTQLIRRLLSSVFLSQGYRRVIMVGMSSGAYISMLVSELMCSEFIDIEFHTFGINPQAAHSSSHRQFVTKYSEFGWHPTLLTDFALSLRDCDVTDVSALMTMNRSRRGNVKHNVYYDSGNISEAYHASLIGGQTGVTLYPQAVALPHIPSCVSMFDKRLIQDAVASLISKPIAASTKDLGC